MNDAGLDRVGNAGLRGGDRPLADREVTGHADLARQRDPSSIVVLPAMPTCAASSTSRADRHAVRDLDEVVDLRAGADARLADGGTIDRRVGADLDVVLDDDAADLRDLVVACRRRARAKPKPSLPMTAPSWTTTRLPSDALADRDAGVDDAVVADHGIAGRS